MPRKKAEEVLSDNATTHYVSEAEENKNFGGEEIKKKKTQAETHKEDRTCNYTHDGHPLTTAEEVFINEYIKTSNARQSYLVAYPACNPKNAHQNAYRKLNQDYVSSEIAYRMRQASTESIATAEEIMQYFTDVMRGKIKDQFGLEASLGERTKAAQELAKRKIDVPNKLAGNEQPTVTIKLDWSRQSAEVIDAQIDGLDDFSNDSDDLTDAFK